MSEIVKIEGGLAESGFNFDLVADWTEFLPIGENSRKTYEKGIKNFRGFLADKNINAPSRHDLLKYRNYLAETYSASTANLYLSSVRRFFNFLEVEGIVVNNPTKGLKNFKESKTHKKNALTTAQVKMLDCTFKNNDLKTLRDKALFEIMVSCGIRTIEASRARVSDFEESDGGYILRIWGKGRNDYDDFVNVPDGVALAILEYLSARGAVSPYAALFASLNRRNYGGQLARGSISRIIKTLFRQNGLDSKKLSAHSCRHTCITAALKGGCTLQQAAGLARHAQISTTLIYSHELEGRKNPASKIAADLFGF